MPNERPSGGTISRSGSTRRANQVRWAWLVTTLTLAAALVVGSWLSYRSAVAAVTTLNRGQADLLEFSLRAISGPGGSGLDSAKLAAFLDENRAAGLRYVAVLDPDGAMVLSAGQPEQPLDTAALPGEDEVRDHPLFKMGGRMRAFFPRPPLHLDPGARQDRRAERDMRRRSERQYMQVIEFAPVAPGLVARARRTLVLAAIGATILALATLFFWRTSLRYDAALVRLEEQRRLTVLGEMSAVLAHEIRNPLASLKGHAQLLTERLADGSSERRKADRVVEEAKRLEVLTSDLLDFARSAPMDLRAEDPVDVLRSSVGDIAEGEIAVDGSRASASWMLDRRRFSHAVLANLLRNAVQAAPASRPPEAKVFTENGNLVFTIRDYGPGLPHGQEERIFDPFFTTRTTGTGLGLPLARRITELHGGHLSAANADGGGAVFRVELPQVMS